MAGRSSGVVGANWWLFIGDFANAGRNGIGLAETG